MTLEEVRDLRDLENHNQLRHSSLAQNLTIEEKDKIYLINTRIRELVDNVSLFVKYFAKQGGELVQVSGSGTREDPYLIDCEYGQGRLYKLNKIFKNLPKWVKKFECFGNCVGMAYVLGQNHQGKVIAGIYDLGKPVMHAVIEINVNGMTCIADFNFNMVIEKDLYIKLFNFEIMAETEFNKIVQNSQHLRHCQLNTVFTAFAFDDLIDYLQDDARREISPLENID